MTESIKLNLFQRINEVRKKLEYIKKEKAVQNYKAVTHDQVTALIRDHLIEQGVIIYPFLTASITVVTGETTSKGTPIIRLEQEYEFVVVNVDDPHDRFTSKVSAHANDQGDKAPGKALSYAKKALVLKLFEIETGEDDESRYQTPETITEEQEANIIALATEVKANMINFRKFLQVDELKNLPSAKYQSAIAALEEKRRAAT